uniref:Amidohydrolase-related domain-containing protein n=1 Tax=Bionectria ochroleuca TaxID=29856 RepID=A0A8H7KCT2_BIOOC
MPSEIIQTHRAQILFPKGGWDTHHHIFEPHAFPYSPTRHLTPPPATIEAFENFRRRLGITNSVLTHGLSYGDDCSSLKDFVGRLGKQSTSAVGVIDPEATSDSEILDMHKSGIRGIRVNLYRYKAMEDTGFWNTLAPFVRREIVPSGRQLITDHFALLKAPSMLPLEYREDPTKQPGFAAIMGLVKDGHLFVKLSAPYRVSEQGPGYDDLEFLVRAFVATNKHQILWGSDWPHTPRMKVRSHEEAMKETPFLEVDDEKWLQTLKSWLSDEEWDLIMVQNPRRLFAA